jgi:peptide/nickel transport system permease protein
MTAVTGRFTRPPLLLRLPMRARIALLVVIAVCVLAAVAPMLPLPDPLIGDLAQRLRPIGTPGHLLGTDSQGRDMLSRLIGGTGTSLIAGIVPAVVATVIGSVIGVAAALWGRAGDLVVMRIVDVLFAFPHVLFALLLTIALGSGLGTLLVALSVIGIGPIAKVAETEVARVRDADYLAVARVGGARTLAIVMRQIVPVILPGVLAYATGMVGTNIAVAGGLGFIGLGVQAPTPELGGIVHDMQTAIFVQPALSVLPALVILLLAILFPLAGDGVRAALGGRRERS